MAVGVICSLEQHRNLAKSLYCFFIAAGRSQDHTCSDGNIRGDHVSFYFASDSESLFDTNAGTVCGCQKTENSCLNIKDDFRAPLCWAAAPSFSARREKMV